MQSSERNIAVRLTSPDQDRPTITAAPSGAPAWLREQLDQTAQVREAKTITVVSAIISTPVTTPVQTPVPAAIPTPVPVPAAGARLFFGDENGNPCVPEGSFHWCWSGEPGRWLRSETWYYTRDTGIPANELTVRPDFPARCRSCAVYVPRVVWTTVKGGQRRLHLECGGCGRYVKALKLPPSPDLVYRATAK
jgi:hypothetical protein